LRQKTDPLRGDAVTLKPEILWASNGFGRFRPRRRRGRLALAVYLLVLGTFFAAGLWALFMD
jgi:hypothetical protein